MTGLTHLQLSYSDDRASETALKLLKLVLSKYIACMPLLTSLEIAYMSFSAVGIAAAHWNSSCPALTDLRLNNSLSGGSSEWGALWSALAGARSLSRLEMKGFIVKSGGDFGGIGSLDQLHCLV